MSMKLKTASGSITLAPEDGSGDISVTIPRAGVLSAGANSVTDTELNSAKLNGIETGATADQSKADIEALGIAASSITGALPAIDGSALTGIDGLPTQTGNSGKYLTTDGSASSWAAVSGGGGGGAWAEISSTTVSSAVAQVEFTLSGYTVYKIIYWGMHWGSNDNSFAFAFTKSGGSYTDTCRMTSHRVAYNSQSGGDHAIYSGNNFTTIEQSAGTRVASTSGQVAGEMTIFNHVGMPVIRSEVTQLDDTWDERSPGISSLAAGFHNPSSTDYISKIKIKGSQGNNIEGGTFTLYGLS